MLDSLKNRFTKAKGSHGVGEGAVSGDAAVKPLRKEERLASVIQETEPGAAVEVMRRNDAFALPGETGWVVMLLPTHDSQFGGLNAKEKNREDKGTIINLVVNDDIHSVVTPELLDSDVLGVIPDADSFDRMDEFDLLRNKARWHYGVAAIEPDTGELVVFKVPAKNSASARGDIFSEVGDVLSGAADLEDVVDFEVIATFLEVLNETSEVDIDDEDGDVPYGFEGVNAAGVITDDLIREKLDVDSYPSSAEIIDNIVHVFTKLQGKHHVAPQPVLHSADVVDVDAQESHDTVVIESPDDVALAEQVDVPDFSDGFGIDDAEVTEPEDEEVVEATADADPFGDVAEDDPFGSDDEPDFGASDVVAAPAPVAGMSDEQIQALIRGVSESVQAKTGSELNALREELAQALAYNPVQDSQAALAQVHAADARSFDADQVGDAVTKRYVNDDLGLYVDEANFNNALTRAPFQVAMPQFQETTPWLGDQLRTLVAVFNGQLLDQHQRDYEEVRAMYIALNDRSNLEIARDLGLDNKDSEFYEVYRAIERDRDVMAGDQQRVESERRQQLQQEYEANREEYVMAKIAEQRVEYDRRHMPRHTASLEAVGRELTSLRDRTIEDYTARMNTLRRARAGERANAAESRIIDELRPIVERQAELQRAAFDGFIVDLDKFIADHREDDLRLASVNEQKLAADNRVAQLTKEAEERIEGIRVETDKMIASQRKALERQEAEFAAELKRRDTIVAASEERAEREITTARLDAEAALKRMEEQIRVNNEAHEAEIVIERDRATQAEANSMTFVESVKQQDRSNNIILIAVLIVGLIAGMVAGAAFF